jgi:hypothetical protein
MRIFLVLSVDPCDLSNIDFFVLPSRDLGGPG